MFSKFWCRNRVRCSTRSKAKWAEPAVSFRDFNVPNTTEFSVRRTAEDLRPASSPRVILVNFQNFSIPRWLGHLIPPVWDQADMIGGRELEDRWAHRLQVLQPWAFADLDDSEAETWNSELGLALARIRTTNSKMQFWNWFGWGCRLCGKLYLRVSGGS